MTLKTQNVGEGNGNRYFRMCLNLNDYQKQVNTVICQHV